MANMTSRTYGGNEGEDIREGFEPTDSPEVIDPKDNEDNNEFVVGDEDEANSPGGEEAREWNETRKPDVVLKPKYGVDGEDFENVWGGRASSEPPKENP
jgi:hypothetical protein